MKSDVKTSLLLLKNKLLLLSLVSTLGATSIGCSSNSFDNDEVESVLEITEEKIEESITVIPDTTLEIEEKLPDSKEEVMNIIDNGSIESIYYVKNDTTLTIPSFLTESKVEEQVTLPKLECLEVYNILDDTCLVKTNEYIGFTTLENLEELTGTFVVVDISSQQVKLYCNNEVILTTPVVTGKPSTPSDKGLFEFMILVIQGI
jgi:lipoprotein